MTSVCRLLPLVIIGSALIAASLAICDVGPLSIEQAGGGAAPKAPHQTIRLDSQEVTIRLKKSSYVVCATFHFFNTGESTTEWVGFPKVGSDVSSFLRFDAWVDGKKAKIREERRLTQDGKDIPERSSKVYGWLVQHVTFPGRARTTIRVVYVAAYTPAHNPYQLHSASYVYGTGRLWLNSIGSAVFIVDGSALSGTESFEVVFKDPPRMRKLVAGTTEMYSFNNLEPSPEAEVKVIISKK